MALPLPDDLYSRINRLELKIDDVHDHLKLMNRELEGISAMAFRAAKDLDIASSRIEKISEKLPVLQVDMAKVQVRHGLVSSLLGLLAGFFGAKLP